MLKNMSVLVTGAAGSLGSATAKALISEGCKVTLLDLPDSRGAELANKLGKNAVFSPADITSHEDVVKTLDLVKDKFGGLRAVVNCAGVHRAGEFYNFRAKKVGNLEKLEEIYRVNVMGVMNVILLALDCMADNPVDKYDSRGVIINTSGFAAFDGQKGQVGLALAWGALSSITLPLSREVGDYGFRVMTIAPGLMDSNLTSILIPKLQDALKNCTPFPKRFGFKEEYASLVIAILKNNFLNGEVIRLDGGLRFHI